MTNEQIIRAWKDGNYRDSLSAGELVQLPANPAGENLTNEELESVVGSNADTVSLYIFSPNAGYCESFNPLSPGNC